MPSVTVYNGNFEKAMRKFKKQVQTSGLLEEYRERQQYNKPSATRKRKQAAAKARERKRVREDIKPKRLY